MRLFVHCAKPHGKFEIWEVSINCCNISLPEVKERLWGGGRSSALPLLRGRRESMGKMSDAFVMPGKCGLPRVHIQNITFLRVEYKI
jgi:hypothetical protein